MLNRNEMYGITDVSETRIDKFGRVSLIYLPSISIVRIVSEIDEIMICCPPSQHFPGAE